MLIVLFRLSKTAVLMLQLHMSYACETVSFLLHRNGSLRAIILDHTYILIVC